MNVRVGVTGANGFIGSALCEAFDRAGWRVVAFCRSATPAAAWGEVRSFDLRQGIDPGRLSDLDVLVHAAYHPDPSEAGTNVSGTRALFEAAQHAGVPQRVFISSMAAGPDSASRYGLEKHAGESLLDPRYDLVVRPGLVVGDGGLFRAMSRAILRYRVAPLFSGGRQPVYVVGIADLTNAIVNLIALRARGIHLIANEDPISMRDLYSAIARKNGCRVIFVPLPLDAALGAAAFMERIGIRLPLGAERLRGIRNLRLQPVSAPPASGVMPLPLDRILESL